MILSVVFILIAFFFIIRQFIIDGNIINSLKNINLIRWYKRRRAAIYKKRKINQSKLDFESDYYIKFKIFLKDKNGNHTFGDDFKIAVPANAAYFARKKLVTYIKENIAIDIIDIKEQI